VGFRNREAACFALLFLTISDNSKVIFDFADVNGRSVFFLEESNISENNKFHFENFYYACLEKYHSIPLEAGIPICFHIMHRTLPSSTHE